MHEFVQAVKNNGCRIGMDGRGDWRNNVVVERLWKSAKYELIYLYSYYSVIEARKSIPEYMTWSNKFRSHSSLGRKSHKEAYVGMLPMAKRQYGKQQRIHFKIEDTVSNKGNHFFLPIESK